MPNASISSRSSTVQSKPTSAAICRAVSAIMVGVAILAGCASKSRARITLSAMMRPVSAPCWMAGNWAELYSTTIKDSTFCLFPPWLLCLGMVYSSNMLASATAWAASCASRPPMPAPCTIVATVFAPSLLAAAIALADAVRTPCKSNASLSPKPTTRTRGAGSAPDVYKRVVSPSLPMQSPRAITSEMRPPRA